MKKNQTRRMPTAAQTIAFAIINPMIMPTAGKGNFRNPGIRLWQAIAHVLMSFFSAGIPILTDFVVCKASSGFAIIIDKRNQ